MEKIKTNQVVIYLAIHTSAGTLYMMVSGTCYAFYFILHMVNWSSERKINNIAMQICPSSSSISQGEEEEDEWWRRLAAILHLPQGIH